MISRAGRPCHFFKLNQYRLFFLADTADSADAFVDDRRIAGISNAADTGNRDVQLLARVNVDIGGARNSNFGALGMQIICFDIARATGTDLDKF